MRLAAVVSSAIWLAIKIAVILLLMRSESVPFVYQNF